MNRGATRTRWAAIGAAVAVTFGAGGLIGAQAAETSDADASVLVPIVPTRILDTRPEYDIGLSDRFTSEAGRTLQVTGVIETDRGWVEAIPADATAIVFNVTVYRPTAQGYVSLRPGDATGTPTTSSINFPPGVIVGNGGTVLVPTDGDAAGTIDVFYKGLVDGAVTDVIIDVTGYYAIGAGAPGPMGPEGPMGPAGADGVDGTDGADGVPGPAGTDGRDGEPGVPGEDGVDGTDGVDGADGDPGPMGPAGETGPRHGRTIYSSRTIATTAADGAEPAVVVGVDGMPLIVHGDTTNDQLLVTYCDDVACDGTGETTTALGFEASAASVTLGLDGLAVIAHTDGDDLAVTHCSDLRCTAFTSTTHATAAVDGRDPDIAIGGDGQPLVVHTDVTAGDLVVAHCADWYCTTVDVATTFATGDGDGVEPAVTVGPTGLAVIAHTDTSGATLVVSACTNATCSTATRSEPVALTAVGLEPTIAIGTDGFPVVAHGRSTTDGLVVTVCADTPCTSASSLDIDVADAIGNGPAVTIDVDGVPIVAHRNSTSGFLTISRCVDAACSNADTFTVDGATDVGHDAAITIGGDGQLLIAHRAATATDLRVTKTWRTAWTTNAWDS